MRKIILFSIGILFLVLGAIGIVLPILPTTPFVIAASGCFAVGSPTMYTWLAGSRYFGEFIKNYRVKSGVSKGTKKKALIFLYVMLFISAVLVNLTSVRLLLLAVAVGVTIHIVMLKTKIEDL